MFVLLRAGQKILLLFRASGVLNLTPLSYKSTILSES